MKEPLVSIIITTYNPVEEYFKITIESILKQTYTNWELIIIDDGSTRDIREIVKNYSDKRIYCKRCDVNRGISACANDGILLANGEFIAKIDDDDIAYPNWLERMMAFLQDKPDANILGCSLKIVGNKNGIEKKNLQPTRERQQAGLLIQNSAIPHSLCVFRKGFIEQYQICYDTSYQSAVDYALWVEMVKYTKFYSLEEILGEYRRHDNQISTKTYSAQQCFADEIRVKQLMEIGIEPNNNQKLLHNKLSRIIELETNELEEMDKWITLIERQNEKNLYFDVKALRQVLHQRVATLYLRYFRRTHSIKAMKFFLKYATLQNVRNGMRKIFNFGDRGE